MDWRTKARVQRVFSALPQGYRLNYLLQRHVTHSLPRSDADLGDIIETAHRHLAAIERHLDRPRNELRCFEFGAGFDLAEPMVSAALGIRNRRCVDVRPIARPAMVRATAASLIRLGLELPPPPDKGPVDGYLGSLGISYVAPGDARATGLPDGSLDACSTTSVLEHIAAEDIRLICAELRRVLAPGGVCSFAIDYHDHFAGSDPAIDGLNFLRYTDDEWRTWNSDLQFQNRLRHDDYVAMFTDIGFELVEVDAVPDPRFPADPPCSDRFAGRSDLAIGDGWFLLRNPRS